jgi:glycosyltransferase involved in cell wall biosynthesis
MSTEENHPTILPADGAAPLAGKRVLVVLGCLDLGGAERQAIHAASCLAHRQQADVQVWAFRPPGRAAELCDRLGIPWRYVPEPWGRGLLRWPMMIGRFARTVRRARPDMLLPYTSFPNVICGLSWRLTGARVCIWNQRDAGLGLASPAVSWAVRNTPLFLSNSAAGAEFLVENLGVGSRRVRVVRNAVQLESPRGDRDAWRAGIGVDPSCFLACMIANLQENKDHATLLRAWRTVCDRLGAQGRRALLVLAGRLDAAEALQRLTDDLQLNRSVRLLGEVDDVPGLLSAADLGVFSSRSEGCPNGVLESMAAGLAVAATDCLGIREAVGELGYVWLAPAGDAEALAERMIRLADDPALRAQLGSANALRIQSEFTLDRMNADLAALLPAALTTRRWP